MWKCCEFFGVEMLHTWEVSWWQKYGVYCQKTLNHKNGEKCLYCYYEPPSKLLIVLVVLVDGVGVLVSEWVMRGRVRR